MNKLPSKKRKPISVLINWSESREFNSEEVYPFMAFEKKALEVALTHPLGGYDKTNVTVTFDDESCYQCRLDLGAKNNDLGFAEHCISIYNLYMAKKDNPEWYWLSNANYLTMIEHFATYQFDHDYITHARLCAEEAVSLAVQEQKRAEHERVEFIRKARQEFQEKEQAFQDALVIPDWAKSVIIATYTEPDEENSIPEIGDYASQKVKTIILTWSRHNRNLFTELRKACLNHSDTVFLNDKEQSTEHRENYAMGRGVFLTNKGYRRHGWRVYKQTFWNADHKASYVPLGELAIPDAAPTYKQAWN